MRKIIVADTVRAKIEELENYLQAEMKFSKYAARKRSDKMWNFLTSVLANPLADYGLCRFKRWRAKGWRCVTSEGWVFAYELFADGIIVRDMSHGKALAAD